MQRWGGPSVSSGKFKRNFKFVFVLCLKVIIDFKINFEIYSKMYCAYLQLWCCCFNHCELNSVHYYRQAKFYRMTERCISVSIYKASAVLYGCDSCSDCVTVFALFLFASTLDHKLISRSNSPCFMHLSRFLYVSVSECGPLPDSEPLMYGEVQSPQYPQPYPPNLQQQWDLSVPEGYQIRLSFTHLDIEASAGCHYDALTVRATFHIRSQTIEHC